MTTITGYIARIRNAKKQAYAVRYAAWLAVGGDDSGSNPPDRGKLSVMAAQAVRMELCELFLAAGQEAGGRNLFEKK